MAYEWINVREVKRQRRAWGDMESPQPSLPLTEADDVNVKEREGSSGSGGPPSREQLTEDRHEWTCSGCNARVQASFDTCYRCRSPKPEEKAGVPAARDEPTSMCHFDDTNLDLAIKEEETEDAGTTAEEERHSSPARCPYCNKSAEKAGSRCLACQLEARSPWVGPSGSEDDGEAPPGATGDGSGPNLAPLGTAKDLVSNGWNRTKEVDRVVYIRLTKQSNLITNTVLSFPGLRKAIIRVNSNGCNISPWWANGGMVLFPYDTEDLEANGKDIGFTRENVVIAASDFNNFCLALLEIPEAERPGLFLEDHRSILDDLLDSDEEDESIRPPTPSTNDLGSAA